MELDLIRAGYEIITRTKPWKWNPTIPQWLVKRDGKFYYARFDGLHANQGWIIVERRR